jgi:hypothetical protein
MGRNWKNRIAVLGKAMPKLEPSRFFLLFLVAVAVFGLALILFLLLQPNLQVDPSPLRRPFIGALYTVVCILGIVAVFYPKKCRMMFQNPKVSQNSGTPDPGGVQFKGHHPECEKFSGNRIAIGSSVFCSACSGLLVGAIVSLGSIVLFSLAVLDFVTGNLWILAVGVIFMLLGLAQIKMIGYVKMAFNALFVVGSCICLIIADLVGQNLMVDVYVLVLVVFMLWLRILLSEWNNKRICLECGYCN